MDLAQSIPLFHRWIQQSRLPGLPIDVVDYRHVPDGPGVMLIGHEADYALDRAEGPLGLLYTRKRLATGSNVERLTDGLRATLAACRALEQEPEFGGRGLTFDGGRLRLLVNDRLAAPNDDATLETLRPDLEAVLGRLYPERQATHTRDSQDSRRRFTLGVEAGEEVDVATLLARLD